MLSQRNALVPFSSGESKQLQASLARARAREFGDAPRPHQVRLRRPSKVPGVPPRDRPPSKKKITFLTTLQDGRKFLATANQKVYQTILGATV